MTYIEFIIRTNVFLGGHTPEAPQWVIIEHLRRCTYLVCIPNYQFLLAPSMIKIVSKTDFLQRVILIGSILSLQNSNKLDTGGYSKTLFTHCP